MSSPMQIDQECVASTRASSVASGDHSVGGPKQNRSRPGVEVFVGRMPLKTTKADLRALVAPYNATQVRILPKRQFPFLCGFVVFPHVQDSKKFIDDYNNRPVLGGAEPINVRFSDGKNGRKKVFIGGLSKETQVEDLKKMAEAFGMVLQVNVLGRKKQAPCGFVTFSSGEEAQECIRNLNGKRNSDDTKTLVVKLGDASIGGKNKDFGSKRSSDESDGACSDGCSCSKRRRRNEAGDSDDSNYQNMQSSDGQFAIADQATSNSWAPQQETNQFIPVQQMPNMFTPMQMQMPMQAVPMQMPMNQDPMMAMQMPINMDGMQMMPMNMDGMQNFQMMPVMDMGMQQNICNVGDQFMPAFIPFQQNQQPLPQNMNMNMFSFPMQQQVDAPAMNEFGMQPVFFDGQQVDQNGFPNGVVNQVC